MLDLDLVLRTVFLCVCLQNIQNIGVARSAARSTPCKILSRLELYAKSCFQRTYVSPESRAPTEYRGRLPGSVPLGERHDRMLRLWKARSDVTAACGKTQTSFPDRVARDRRRVPVQFLREARETFRVSRIRPPAGVLSAMALISSVDADCLPIAFLLDWKHDTRGIHGQTSTDPGGISR